MRQLCLCFAALPRAARRRRRRIRRRLQSAHRRRLHHAVSVVVLRSRRQRVADRRARRRRGQRLAIDGDQHPVPRRAGRRTRRLLAGHAVRRLLQTGRRHVEAADRRRSDGRADQVVAGAGHRPRRRLARAAAGGARRRRRSDARRSPGAPDPPDGASRQLGPLRGRARRPARSERPRSDARRLPRAARQGGALEVARAAQGKLRSAVYRARRRRRAARQEPHARLGRAHLERRLVDEPPRRHARHGAAVAR